MCLYDLDNIFPLIIIIMDMRMSIDSILIKILK
jgi:hypothetical protein